MKGVMIQGTASNVGKSLLATALCRLLVNKGYSVAPFKAQNMSNQSYVTTNHKEIGIAQAQQAEASCIQPIVQMNPVLLKPLANGKTEVVLQGETQDKIKGGHFKQTYYELAKQSIQSALQHMQQHYEVLVLEGAGSPVEMNLKSHELANMAIADMADVPVILVADIDRGGVFASIVGTLQLLTGEERSRVKGIIINKFRGDVISFKTGMDWLEKYTSLPVLGVVPYVEHGLAEEDTLSDRETIDTTREQREESYDALADHLERFVNVEKLESIIAGEQV